MKKEIQCQAITEKGRCREFNTLFYPESAYRKINGVPTYMGGLGEGKWVCPFHHRFKNTVIGYSDEEIIIPGKRSKLFEYEVLPKAMFALVILMLSPILIFQIIVSKIGKAINFIREGSR